MIALDTNVVVRLFVEDDPDQTACARRLVERAILEEAFLYVTTVVLVESVWVLSRAYGFGRAEVAGAVADLLASSELHVEHAAEAQRALDAFLAGRGDYSDYLIREVAAAAGVAAVATFDRALLREDGFTHPDPGKWIDGTSVREETPRYGRGPRRRGRRALAT